MTENAETRTLADLLRKQEEARKQRQAESGALAEQYHEQRERERQEFSRRWGEALTARYAKGGEK